MPTSRGSYSFPIPDGEGCPTGAFSLALASGLCEWSEGLYSIHGYARGEVVPTLDLVMAHKHPDDREAAGKLITDIRSGAGQGAIFHRIIDSKGREHRVLTVAEGDLNGDGHITAIHGLTIDLTRALAVESGHVAAAALVNAYGTRAVIEQAKGILMGHFNVGPEEAFELLATQSQNNNIKVAALAAALVAAAAAGRISELLRQWDASSTAHRRKRTADLGGGTDPYQTA